MITNEKIGFIGGGMMAEAIIAGLVREGGNCLGIMVSDTAEARRKHLSESYAIQAVDDNAQVAMTSRIVIIAVKPDVVPIVLSDIRDHINSEKLVVSIAAGVSTSSIESRLPDGAAVIRVMPNAPALIGMSATGVARGSNASSEDMAAALEIFSAVGKAIEVPESKMDAVTGLSGSGPAFVYLMIESLADGGVRMGLPRSTALTLAAQTVAGTAEMVLRSDDHPAVLKDRVATPGGTTIEGLAVLEKGAVRNSMIEAVTAATRKSAELGNGK